MRVLDLFSGVGMMAYSMEKAGHEVVAFCEIEEWPRKVLAKHWPDVPQFTDVRELNYERLESAGVADISIITGGFPCQDLSVAGKQAGIKGERSGLFDEILRIACDIRTHTGRLPILLLENVSALLTGANGEWAGYVFGRLSEVLADSGGGVIESHVIPAGSASGTLSAGAPHRRERVWIVAYSQREGLEGQSRHVKDRNQPGRERAGTDRSTSQENLRRGQRDKGTGPTEPNLGLLANGTAARLAGSRWLPEPPVGRVATGVPDRVQKLKALGNGLIWQIPYAIGCAINDKWGES
jgi:DNA (cytosine-5)-methyltransferase 1